jgi:aspartate racemase
MGEIKKMKKRIGILGGISYESTKNYYELIHKKYYDIKKDYYYPEVIIYSLNFQKFTDYENTDSEKYLSYIISGLKGLETTQVDFIIMAANSPHSVYSQLIDRIKTPVYSIADAVIAKAKEKNLKKILLLGIKHTMDSEFYPNAGKSSGIEVIVPKEEDKLIVDKIIFHELCIGEINNTSKSILLNIISKNNVDGVILGCTELPQIIQDNDLKIEILNTLELHVEYAINKLFE